MSAILDALHSGRALLMDGAMGTELRRAGLPDGMYGETWNITYPERVQAVHQAYAEAGADVLLANTFQAYSAAMTRFSGERFVSPSCEIDPAKQFLGPFISEGKFTLLSVGPITEPPDPLEFPHLRQVALLAGYLRYYHWDPEPASGTLLETCSTPRVRFAVSRLEWVGLPVLLSLTYQHNAKGKIVTLSGHKPEWFAQRAKHWGIAALGVNCGRDIDMDDIIEIIRRYRAVTDLPLFARPNAGTPRKQGDRWIYPYTPESMAARLPELLEAGVSMVGGCCGTTPEHIAAFRAVIDEWNQ